MRAPDFRALTSSGSESKSHGNNFVSQGALGDHPRNSVSGVIVVGEDADQGVTLGGPDVLGGRERLRYAIIRETRLQNVDVRGNLLHPIPKPLITVCQDLDTSHGTDQADCALERNSLGFEVGDHLVRAERASNLVVRALYRP